MRRFFSALKPHLRSLLQHRYTLYEWMAITAIGLLYVGLLFSHQAYSGQPRENMALTGLDPEIRLISIEHERLSGILIPVYVGLEKYDQIPTWNPYLSAGVPLVNNAFSYLFNPFASVPVLALGPVQGAKLALIISLLISGYTMWALSKVIGLGAVARISTAALYMMSGSIIGKFHVGHFQLGLSLAWVPLVLAGLWWTLKSEDRRAPVLMAVAFTLLFFSGNIYYSLHTILSCAVITVFYTLSREEGRWRWHGERLRRVIIGGLFALGLSALFFLPVWSTRAFVSHPGDPELVNRYPLFQAFGNFVLPYEAWQEFENVHVGLMVVVDYAYIGPMVFLLIGLMGIISLFQGEASRHHQRAALIALVLALTMMIWGAGQSGLLQSLYANIPLLAQFRYVGRAHAIAALWWIVLGGISLDVLWRFTRERYLPQVNHNSYIEPQQMRPDHFIPSERAYLWVAALLGVGAWLWFVVYSLSDNLTRLRMAFMDLNLYRTLNGMRFLHLPEAVNQFWYVVIALMALALMVFFVWQGIRQFLYGDRPLWLRQGGVSVLRFGVIVLSFAALADVVQVNGRLLHTNYPSIRNHFFYPTVFAEDPYPIPIIHESYSPAAYEAYLHGVRNWGLDEGWLPVPVHTDRPVQGLQNFPAWAIVSSEYVDANYASMFIDGHSTRLQACSSALTPDGQCNISGYGQAALYQLVESLPYAFIVDEAQLFSAPESVTVADVQPVQVLVHRQDTITLRATAPETSGRWLLVVKETHFPGWQASINNQPALSHSIGAYIGIELGAGTQTYTLRYQPPNLAGGLVISLITLMLMGFYWRGPMKKAAPIE